ncbi:DUF4097 domain-containing protein [Nonomuraea sp. FMUSA5-5]|uniref:DUF4097 domain-containing protein n=1 Tax=Nonomuraea composti TaxID=2720023 RepID=A0ABX1BF50_9ACTN|nr:DUF4097 domain-containing protein [Nonomuraea sp. FMUSA5-5]
MQQARAGARPLWLAAGAVVLAFTVLACTVTVLSWLGRQSETQHQEYRRPARLQIDVTGTEVVLQAYESGAVEVERHLTWASGKPAPRERWEGDTLRLSIDCPPALNLPGCSAVYRVWLPADLPVTVRTVSGAVRLANLRGPVSVETDSGDVRGEGLGGGQVSARAGSGDVRLGFSGVPSRVAARTSSGDIALTLPRHAYNVRADSVEGMETVAVGQDPSSPATIEARTDTADITIGDSTYAP